MKQSEPIKKRPRRKYDEEFKAEALRLVDQGRTVPDVASKLGISENLIYNWRSAAKGKLPEDDRKAYEEIQALRKQLARVEMERDILKKALAIFSKTT